MALVGGESGAAITGLEGCLRSGGYAVRRFHTPPNRRARQERRGPRLVIWCLDDGSDPDPFHRNIRVAWPGTPVMGAVCGSRGPDPTAKLWALLDDYVTWPCRPIDLLPRVRRLVGHEGAGGSPSDPRGARRRLVGRSVVFERTLESVALIAEDESNVLVRGETGTGKELFARAIHYGSARRRGPFIPVNCGALPDTLLESEVFGHTRGAFTDAREGRRGLLDESQGGTIFLDEIDALSAGAQVKVLRFLQEKEFRPVGSAETKFADVRVIAATNARLSQCVRVGEFREDLFYRLNILPLHLPALRERTDDIEPLVEHFLRQFRREGDAREYSLGRDALAVLKQYAWPGNVRELESVVHRTMVFARRRTSSSPKDGAIVFGAEDLALDVGLTGVESEPFAGTDLSFNEAKTLAIDSFERSYLTAVLEQEGGNVSRAAERSGKDRRTFQRLLRKHQLGRSLQS